MTVKRIAMWSGPRNISTTMMRAFENRKDCIVVDEPFYAHYLARSGADHPFRDEVLAAQPNRFEDVVSWLSQPPTDFGDAHATVIFQKHIAYHFPVDGDLLWLEAHQPFVLIRDPRAMVASYARKYDDVAPITDSLAVVRRVHEETVAARRPCPIVDATDILKDPRRILSALCAALDIPFTERMLSWPAGPRNSDGLWGPHWYPEVSRSTGFRPFRPKSIELTPALDALADQCGPDYAFLYQRRLTG